MLGLHIVYIRSRVIYYGYLGLLFLTSHVSLILSQGEAPVKNIFHYFCFTQPVKNQPFQILKFACQIPTFEADFHGNG